MTNQPTDNEWIEKARQQYSMCMSPKRHEIHCELFKQSIISNIPKPTEVVAPVDIDKILNEYFTDTMLGTPRVELERILRKHLKLTTPVEPINQERTDSEVVQGE